MPCQTTSTLPNHSYSKSFIPRLPKSSSPPARKRQECRIGRTVIVGLDYQAPGNGFQKFTIGRKWSWQSSSDLEPRAWRWSGGCCLEDLGKVSLVDTSRLDSCAEVVAVLAFEPSKLEIGGGLGVDAQGSRGGWRVEMHHGFTVIESSGTMGELIPPSLDISDSPVLSVYSYSGSLADHGRFDSGKSATWASWAPVGKASFETSNESTTPVSIFSELPVYSFDPFQNN